MSSPSALRCPIRESLVSVCTEIKRLLMHRCSVYLTDFENTYRMRVFDARVSFRYPILQVKTVSGWSSVCYCEKVVDSFGDSLFENRKEKEFVTQTIDTYVEKIGDLKSSYRVKEVF